MDRELGIYKRIIVPILSVLLIACIGVLIFVWIWYGPGYYSYWWYDGGVYYTGDETLEVKPGPDITKQDAEKFCDSIFVLKSQQKCEIAGNPPPAACAVIAEKGIVKALKTYGSQEVAANIAVNPEETLFRADALSKLFTNLAILKLSSYGKIPKISPLSQLSKFFSFKNDFLKTDITSFVEDKIPFRLGRHLVTTDNEKDKTNQIILYDFRFRETMKQMEKELKDVSAKYKEAGDISILDLMLGTSGIDFETSHTSATNKDRVMTLEEFVKSHPPRVVRQPGVFCVENPYETVLLGRIIEIASGKPFEKYMHDEIFVPLGMNKTTFEQPEDGTANLAKPRNWVKKPKDEVGHYEEIPQYFTNIAPANGLKTTVGDMSRFMAYLTAMLNHHSGEVIDASKENYWDKVNQRVKQLEKIGIDLSKIGLIPPEYLALITTGLFDSIADPKTSKTPIFLKSEREYEGGTVDVCSLDLFQNGYGMSFVLIPDKSICVFGACAGGGMWQFESEFYSKFFPQKIDTECRENPKVKIPNPERYTGEWCNFVQMNTPAKAQQLADYHNRSYVENDYLHCFGNEYVMVDELTFIGRYDANNRIKFIEDSSGNIAYIGNFWTMERVPFIGSNNFSICFTLFGLLVILTGLFGFLIGAFLRKSKGEKSTLLEWLARINVAANTAIASVLAVGMVLGMILMRWEDYGFGMPWWGSLGLVLALVATVLALSMAYFTFIIWKNRLWTLGSRIHYTIITVFFLFAPFWLWHWNLLGFTY